MTATGTKLEDRFLTRLKIIIVISGVIGALCLGSYAVYHQDSLCCVMDGGQPLPVGETYTTLVAFCLGILTLGILMYDYLIPKTRTSR